jgi:AraC-like DNA-binding protein
MTEQTDGEPLIYLAPVALPEAEFLVAKNCVRKWRYFHERYAVSVAPRASADVRYRGRSHQCRDGSYLLLEPGETHVNRVVPRPQNYTVLFMSPAAVEQAAGELGAQRIPHFAAVLENNPAIIRAFELLAAAITESDAVLEQQSRFALFTRVLLENCVERAKPFTVRDSTSHRAPIERAKMYLRERFNESITLDELARAAALSRFHLLRTFTRQVGIPPHAYQIRVRIEHARRLLRMGMPSVAAANAVGFADQSHLTRHFKRVLYETPGAYARVGT